MSTEDLLGLAYFRRHHELMMPTVSRCTAFVGRMADVGIAVQQGKELVGLGLLVADEVSAEMEKRP